MSGLGGTWEPDEDEYGSNGHRPLNRVDLADLVAGPHERPKIHGHVIYPHKLHVIGGEPGHGKSTLMYWWLLMAIALRYPVVLFDWEAGRDHTADVLASFGADPTEIRKYLHYYPHSQRTWSEADVVGVAAELRAIKPVIVGLDSSIAVLTSMGGNENSPTDIRRMWMRIALLAEGVGCSVIATDHSGKDAGESRYNRGSTDKLAAVDVSMKLTALEQFSRSQDGRLLLTVTKDRPGWLHWFWEITVTRDPLTLHWARTSRLRKQPGQMSGGKQRVYEALTPEPATLRTVIDRLALADSEGRGMSRQWAGTYLAELAETGMAERIDQGSGRESLWCLPAAAVAPPEPKQGTLV